MAAKRLSGVLAPLLISLVGGVFAAVGWFQIVAPEWEVNRSFVEGKCEVLDKSIVSEQRRRRSSSGRIRSSSAKKRTVYRPVIRIRHEVNGQPFEAGTWRIVESWSSSESSQKKILDRFEKGGTYPCWYDPADPSRVVLEKGFSFGGIAFTLVGGAMFFAGVLFLLRGLASR